MSSLDGPQAAGNIQFILMVNKQGQTRLAQYVSLFVSSLLFHSSSPLS
jgi:hypothetical protein